MRGIVLQAPDDTIRKLAKRQGLAVDVRPDGDTPFDRTLFIRPGVRIPWEMLSVGFEFLDHWEAAAPIWSYDTLASDVATGADRKRTEGLMRDLRVPLYAHELLFVRTDAGGMVRQAHHDNSHPEASTEPAEVPVEGSPLQDAWREEIEAVPGGDLRLAFVRALYRVKPLFLALPRSWLGPTAGVRTRRPSSSRAPARRSRARAAGSILVKVEVGPGRYVRCNPGEEERVIAAWAERRLSRKERRERRSKR